MVTTYPAAIGQARPHGKGFCAHTMGQHDFDGKLLFIHHNQLKMSKIEEHAADGYTFFGLQKAVPSSTKTTAIVARALPRQGLVLSGAGKTATTLACIDIEFAVAVQGSSRISDLRSPKVEDSGLASWETLLFASFYNTKSVLLPQLRMREVAAVSRSRRAIEQNVTGLSASTLSVSLPTTLTSTSATSPPSATPAISTMAANAAQTCDFAQIFTKSGAVFRSGDQTATQAVGSLVIYDCSFGYETGTVTYTCGTHGFTTADECTVVSTTLECNECNKNIPKYVVVKGEKEVVELVVEIESVGIDKLTEEEMQVWIETVWDSIRVEASVALPTLLDLDPVSATSVPRTSTDRKVVWTLTYTIELLSTKDKNAVEGIEQSIMAMVTRINTGETVIVIDVDSQESEALVSLPTTFVSKSVSSVKKVAPNAAAPNEAVGIVLISIDFCTLEVNSRSFDAGGFVADTVNAVLEKAAEMTVAAISEVGLRVGPSNCAAYKPRKRRTLGTRARDVRDTSAETTMQGLSVDFYLVGLNDTKRLLSVVTQLRQPLLKVRLSSLGIKVGGKTVSITSSAILSVPETKTKAPAHRRDEQIDSATAIAVTIVFFLSIVCCLLAVAFLMRLRQPPSEVHVTSFGVLGSSPSVEPLAWESLPASPISQYVVRSQGPNGWSCTGGMLDRQTTDHSFKLISHTDGHDGGSGVYYNPASSPNESIGKGGFQQPALTSGLSAMENFNVKPLDPTSASPFLTAQNQFYEQFRCRPQLSHSVSKNEACCKSANSRHIAGAQADSVRVSITPITKGLSRSNSSSSNNGSSSTGKIDDNAVVREHAPDRRAAGQGQPPQGHKLSHKPIKGEKKAIVVVHVDQL
jgi:hypothetical protein